MAILLRKKQVLAKNGQINAVGVHQMLDNCLSASYFIAREMEFIHSRANRKDMNNYDRH